MELNLRSERDVEAKVIAPLFRDILGYPDEDMSWGVPVDMQFGREVKTKEADLVVSHQGANVVVVEAKKPTEPVLGATGQTDSYAFALQCPFSFITNGREYLLRGYYHANRRVDLLSGTIGNITASEFDKLARIISATEVAASSSESPQAITSPDREKIKDYRRFFKGLHNAIRDGDKLDPAAAFDELGKMLLLSAADEALKAANPDHEPLSKAAVESAIKTTSKKASRLINLHFDEVVQQAFPLLSEKKSSIELSPGTVAEILGKLRPFSVRSEDVDLKGRAFEEFLPSQLRGKGLGQYFTPRPLVEFMCEIAEVSVSDVLLDFSCGSGGFLINAYERMREEVELIPEGTLRRLGQTRESLIEDVKNQQIFGIDAEPRAARTARMNMLLWGDGRCVTRGNALAEKDSSGEPYPIQPFDEKMEGSGCTLILANPPFGAREKDQKVLKQYRFGSRVKQRKSQKTEILFVERAIQLLRPEGRLAIVLPTGLLSADSFSDLRGFILRHAQINAVISLPTHAFVQSGVPTVNTVILYLQKHPLKTEKILKRELKDETVAAYRSLASKRPELDYPIFMGMVEDIGYEPNGRLTNGNGRTTDLDLILEDLRKGESGKMSDLDIFEYAEKLYKSKGTRRREQTVRGSGDDLKFSFIKRASELTDRLDPSSYILDAKLASLSSNMEHIGTKVKEVSKRFRPSTDEELDQEYDILTVSSDGKITIRETVRGEDITGVHKIACEGDIVFNPMRANIGSIGLVGSDLDGGLVSPDYRVVRADGIDAEYLVGLLRTPFYKMYIDVLTTGSIRDRLYPAHLQAMRMPRSKVAQQQELKKLQKGVDEEAERAATAMSALEGGLNAAIRRMLKVD
ncbi:N-6 DNA methylase [Tropicibacter alexandrii]|uniref:N-6 DNA methylase n=1 Tax=Tropicibacter alexandrii TaxID=2267683 RepID=UPI000EF5036A|nr:N-6 DNA methylase [Tropicibacter alexandrii]